MLRAVEFWRTRSGTDVGVAVVGSALARIASGHLTVPPSERAGLYFAGVSVAVGFGALAVTPVAIMVALSPGRLLGPLIASRRVLMVRVLAAGLTWSFLAAFGLLALAATDNSSSPRWWGPYVGVALMSGVASSLGRLGSQWLTIVKVALKDYHDEQLVPLDERPKLRAVEGR